MKQKTRKRGETKEYDFSSAVVGKYAAAYRRGTNIVVLDPDVQEAFPDSAHVNEALRALIDVARRAHVRRR